LFLGCGRLRLFSPALLRFCDKPLFFATSSSMLILSSLPLFLFFSSNNHDIFIFFRVCLHLHGDPRRCSIIHTEWANYPSYTLCLPEHSRCVATVVCHPNKRDASAVVQTDRERQRERERERDAKLCSGDNVFGLLFCVKSGLNFSSPRTGGSGGGWV